METENRLHTRARVKWPVSIKAPTGIIDGTTENLSLSGAFIRLSKQLNSSAEIPLVLARIFHELLSRDHATGNPLAGLSGAQRARIRWACHRVDDCGMRIADLRLQKTE